MVSIAGSAASACRMRSSMASSAQNLLARKQGAVDRRDGRHRRDLRGKDGMQLPP
ncbi:hypothetical protein AKJ09_08303 [Labilithrix luteola]|uniref:Uncharacterized protein n=1 Tax=Labilithrix luteola TaxID=1391654 RepID=A0A0K1Q8A7_9BACT|nr:hypothetical protein AKJ09_08303 [Labilithrix luteola]